MAEFPTFACAPCLDNQYPLKIILYFRVSGETQRGIDKRIRTKGGNAVNGQQQRQDGIGLDGILLLVILYVIFNPIPGPIDDAVVASIGGYQALKRL